MTNIRKFLNNGYIYEPKTIIFMKSGIKMILTIGAAAALCSCSQGEKKTQDTDFHYLLDEFADLKVIRFRVPGWDNLSLWQK